MRGEGAGGEHQGGDFFHPSFFLDLCSKTEVMEIIQLWGKNQCLEFEISNKGGFINRAPLHAEHTRSGEPLLPLINKVWWVMKNIVCTAVILDISFYNAA